MSLEAIVLARNQNPAVVSRTVSASGSMNAGTYRGDLAITGSGFLEQISVYLDLSTLALTHALVTVDGGTAYIVGCDQTVAPTSAMHVSTATNSHGAAIFLGKVRFRRSLSISIYLSSSATNPDTVSSAITYSLTT